MDLEMGSRKGSKVVKYGVKPLFLVNNEVKTWVRIWTYVLVGLYS